MKQFSKCMIAIAIAAIFVISALAFSGSVMAGRPPPAPSQTGTCIINDQGLGYTLGQTISITGTGSGGAGGTKAYFQIVLQNPSGTTIARSPQYWTTTFSATLTYTLLLNDPTGTWKAITTYNVPGKGGKVTTTALAADTTTVRPAALPDLMMIDIWTNPDPPISELPMVIWFSYSTNSVPFSQTASIDIYIGGLLRTTIYQEGSSGANTYTQGIGFGMPSGNHEVKVVLDSTNAVAESSETNNQRIETFGWIPLDIAVVDIWTIPASPIAGEPATIYYQISTDVAPFTQTIYTDLYIDGVKKDTQSLAGSLGANTITYSYVTDPSSTPPGNHEIKVITDSTDKVYESDQHLVTDSDNQRIETINWQAIPNVMAVDIWTDPAEPIGGQYTIIYYSIATNSVPFAQTITTDLLIDNVLAKQVTLAGSAGSSTYTYSYLAGGGAGNPSDGSALPIGWHSIKVLADSGNVLTEIRETDNERLEDIYWKAPLPDIIAVGIYVDPASPIGGQSATISYQIMTVSTPFPQTIYTDLYIDGVKTFTDALAGTTGDTVKTYYHAITLAPGDHVLRMVTDSTNAVAEAWETNNERTRTVTWQALQDFSAVDIWTNPASPVGGQSATISYQISLNTVQWSGTVYTDLYIDGGSVARQSLIWSAGMPTTYTYTYTTTLAAGNHEIKMITDATNVVTELSEANNQRIETVTWSAPPIDLIVQSISLYDVNGIGNPSQITSGQPCRIDVVIKNQGTVSTGVAFYVQLSESGIIKGLTSTLALAAGSTRTITWTNVGISTIGTPQIQVNVDSTNVISESSETNNILYRNQAVVKAKWTILAYLDGDNDLETEEIIKFLDLSSIGSSASLSIFAKFDRISGYDTSYGDWTVCYEFFITYGMDPIPSSAIGGGYEDNMDSYAALKSFLERGADRFKADRYIVLIDDHGGDFAGCCIDVTTGDNIYGPSTIQLSGLNYAFNAMSAKIGKKVDIVVMNCCLMGAAEVACELDDSSSYAIVFETDGFTELLPYYRSEADKNGIIEYLANNKDATTLALVQQMVQLSNFDGLSPIDSFTVAAYDLSKVADLITKINNLATALIADIGKGGNYWDAIEWAREGAPVPIEIPGPFDTDSKCIVDLADWAYSLYTAYHSWMFNDVYKTSQVDDIADQIYTLFYYVGSGYLVVALADYGTMAVPYGMSIYHPYMPYNPAGGDGVYNPEYRGYFAGSLTTTTQWDEYLEAYIAH